MSSRRDLFWIQIAQGADPDGPVKWETQRQAFDDRQDAEASALWLRQTKRLLPRRPRLPIPSSLELIAGVRPLNFWDRLPLGLQRLFHKDRARQVVRPRLEFPEACTVFVPVVYRVVSTAGLRAQGVDVDSRTWIWSNEESGLASIHAPGSGSPSSRRSSGRSDVQESTLPSGPNRDKSSDGIHLQARTLRRHARRPAHAQISRSELPDWRHDPTWAAGPA